MSDMIKRENDLDHNVAQLISGPCWEVLKISKKNKNIRPGPVYYLKLINLTFQQDFFLLTRHGCFYLNFIEMFYKIDSS